MKSITPMRCPLMAMVLGFGVEGQVYNSAVLCSGAGVSEWGGLAILKRC